MNSIFRISKNSKRNNVFCFFHVYGILENSKKLNELSDIPLGWAALFFRLGPPYDQPPWRLVCYWIRGQEGLGAHSIHSSRAGDREETREGSSCTQ